MSTSPGGTYAAENAAAYECPACHARAMVEGGRVQVTHQPGCARHPEQRAAARTGAAA